MYCHTHTALRRHLRFLHLLASNGHDYEYPSSDSEAVKLVYDCKTPCPGFKTLVPVHGISHPYRTSQATWYPRNGDVPEHVPGFPTHTPADTGLFIFRKAASLSSGTFSFASLFVLCRAPRATARSAKRLQVPFATERACLALRCHIPQEKLR
jgi:hypothetical protein